jgi:hypothetical protein
MSGEQAFDLDAPFDPTSRYCSPAATAKATRSLSTAKRLAGFLQKLFDMNRLTEVVASALDWKGRIGP